MTGDPYQGLPISNKMSLVSTVCHPCFTCFFTTITGNMVVNGCNMIVKPVVRG